MSMLHEGGLVERTTRTRTVAWAAGSLVVGALLGSGVTWAVISGQGDSSTEAVGQASPTPSSTVVESAPADEHADATPTAPIPEDATDGCTAVVTSHESWEGGFKVEVELTAGSEDLEGWTASVQVGPDAQVGSSWRTRPISVDEGVATFGPEEYNTSVDAGAKIDFGFDGSGDLTEDVRASCFTEQ
ncbi:cellulose binding domain-containing protein [Demequina zhanjiangensis]|uniref:Cellulose binding domain-containing protein n=1 Tax=Demequina zhanjiangensis TaxID=3051659 RepID=A0ABT8G4U6_9MICO|nr:cellulose binding domain-containing protein [Demequina sp. SYSU T00b26]MDN4474143.1 cellulose binding domain-containing protein [Demequina sp. SYSU T00b26]